MSAVRAGNPFPKYWNDRQRVLSRFRRVLGKADKPMVTLSLLSGEFGICRLDASSKLPSWATAGPFFSITGTPEELSVVCPVDFIPREVICERGWRCLKVHGPLDFSQTRVLLSLVEPLAHAGISVFAISTYDTDYLLVKTARFPEAIKALQSAGHRVMNVPGDL